MPHVSFLFCLVIIFLKSTLNRQKILSFHSSVSIFNIFLKIDFFQRERNAGGLFDIEQCDTLINDFSQNIQYGFKQKNLFFIWWNHKNVYCVSRSGEREEKMVEKTRRRTRICVTSGKCTLVEREIMQTIKPRLGERASRP